jgi:lipoprotein-anchoring transpeptidase ErfK/SrfK
MYDRAYGVKQSDFTQQTSIISGSFLGFFANGYNYKISYDNFLGGLGVTGSIAQDGASTGTPVLDIQGTVNYIRNLEDGSGIVTNVSAENGITIAHNFTVNTTGQPLMQDIAAASPMFVSLVGGTGISCTTVGDTIEIASTDAASYASVSVEGNATATVIASTATPVKVAGTFVVGDISTGWTATTDGRITHTGPSSRHIINAIATLDASSGPNRHISLYIAKNGSVISTKMTATISAGSPHAIATFANVILATNDYIELFVRNETATTSVIAVNAVLSVL